MPLERQALTGTVAQSYVTKTYNVESAQLFSCAKAGKHGRIHFRCVHMQATLPKRVGVEGGTFKPYMKGVYLAYAMVCYCYFTVAICGYWAFGESVGDNVLLSIKHPKWVVAVADMFVVVHVFGSYQVGSEQLIRSLSCVIHAIS